MSPKVHQIGTYNSLSPLEIKTIAILDNTMARKYYLNASRVEPMSTGNHEKESQPTQVYRHGIDILNEPFPDDDVLTGNKLDECIGIKSSDRNPDVDTELEDREDQEKDRQKTVKIRVRKRINQLSRRKKPF